MHMHGINTQNILIVWLWSPYVIWLGLTITCTLFWVIRFRGITLSPFQYYSKTFSFIDFSDWFMLQFNHMKERKSDVKYNAKSGQKDVIRIIAVITVTIVAKDIIARHSLHTMQSKFISEWIKQLWTNFKVQQVTHRTWSI